MTSSAVRMIAIDIDGTLVPGSGRPVTQRNREALLAAEANGLQIVIATGRRQDYAMPVLEGIGLDPKTTIITSNGTVTRTFDGKPINEIALKAETARALCILLRKFGTAVFTFDRNGRGALVLESLEKLSARISHWVKANLANLTEVQPLESAFDSGECPIQGMLAGTLAEMAEAEALLSTSPLWNDIAVHRTEYTDRDLCILDLLPPGISKGWALREYAEGLGIKREQIMAIGDNYNDLDMLSWVGHPVLMGNAPKELQLHGLEKGWRLAPRNDQDGVAFILESLLDSSRPQEEDPSGVVEFS